MLARAAEPCVVDVSNVHILRTHLLCAAAEAPLALNSTDAQVFGAAAHKLAAGLLADGLLAPCPGDPSELVARPGLRMHATSLRNVHPDPFKVVDDGTGGTVLDTMPPYTAFFHVRAAAGWCFGCCRGGCC